MAKTSTLTVFFDRKIAKYALGQIRESTSLGPGGGRKSPFSFAFPFNPAFRAQARELGEGKRCRRIPTATKSFAFPQWS